jgi:hypothetical protein
MKSSHILLYLVFLFLCSVLIFLYFGPDLVSNQFQSDCLLSTLFLIGCVELSLLVFFLKDVMYSARKRELKRIPEQE